MTSTTATSTWKDSFSWEKTGIAMLFLLGALLRIRQYLTGRSFWVDEAMLALNIVNRGFAEMFLPLDYDQGAPIGFLLVEKTFHSILGKSEFALRLFPLLVGLLSLYLFYLLLRRTTNRAGLFTGLTLFALNPRLIYYSSEVKQYIVDVAVTISLLLIATSFFKASPRKKDFIWLTLAGLIAAWFSHPALFVLAGIGLGLVIVYAGRRDYASLRYVIASGILWVLNIAFLYVLILKDLSRNAYMREYWQGAFFPMPPWSDAGWFLKSMNENVSVQLGIPHAILFAFSMLVIGWIALLLENREYAIAFACIGLVTMAASALQFYPVFERMILFLVPLGLILLSQAIGSIHTGLQKYSFLGTLIVALLAGYLIYGPLVTSVRSFIAPKYFEHIRPTMEYLRDSWKDGDALYVSNGALPAFRYYAPFYGLESILYEYGKREDYKNPQNIVRPFESFEGRPRVWILFSHVYAREDFNEKDFILNDLNHRGEKKREFRVPGTSVFLYLYDLEN